MIAHTSERDQSDLLRLWRVYFRPNHPCFSGAEKRIFFGDSHSSIMAVTGGTCPMVAVSLGTLRPHVISLSLGAGVALALELAIICIVSVGWITFPSTQSGAASTILRTDIICRSTVGHQRR